MSKFKVSISVLNMDFSRLRECIEEVEKAGADSLHLDIMDGHFVDNISYGPGISKTIINIASVPVHAHLMIEDPLKYADRFFAAGCASVTPHVETLGRKNEHVLQKPHTGISLNPDAPLSKLGPYLKDVERVLVMSVMAGFGGQSFMKKSLKRIESLKKEREKAGLDFIIEVDGGINDKTALECVKAGADEVIVGSWVTSSQDPAGKVKYLKSLA
ncbi:MAG: ribulose-phosphate 3-epimerase [Elusimicrobiota bacterium]